MTQEEIRERERVPMEVDLRKSDAGEMKKEENKEAESYGDERGCKEEIVLQDYYQLEKTKAEMGKVIEENQRLKMYLDRILKDYGALQMQYQDFVRQESKKTTSASAVYSHQNTQGSELLSLSLGRSSSTDTKNDETYSLSKRKVDEEEEEDKAGLALRLVTKFKVPKTTPTESSTNNPSPENSKEEAKKEAREICPPNKFPKAERNGDEQVFPQNLTKRARVSLRVRCDTPAMDDGCRWRKYGQKISKGNPCPKAYYRCTFAPSCPVRKQVQRCVDDMSVLIITYEGTHNHPLPVSATAMASATSAAASMLISGSTTSISGPNWSTDFNGLNNFYFQNSPISSLPLCPTITLDLTSSPSSFSSLSHLCQLQDFTQKHSTTNLNFNSLNSNALPISWTNGIQNYGTQYCSFNFEAQSQENFHQQSLLSQDTIAAITSNPGFQSALAAALTSVIGSGSRQQGNQSLADNISSRNIEPFPVLSSFPSATNADKFVPKFLNKSHDGDHFI